MPPSFEKKFDACVSLERIEVHILQAMLSAATDIFQAVWGLIHANLCADIGLGIE